MAAQNTVSLNSFINPLDPTSAADAYRVQRQQAMAQALQAQALQPLEDTLPKNMPVMPRLGIGHGLTKLAQALLANYSSTKADEDAGSLQQSNMQAIMKALDPNAASQAVPAAVAAPAALQMGAVSGNAVPTSAQYGEVPTPQPGAVGAETNRAGPTPQTAALMQQMATPAAGSTGSSLNPLKMNSLLAARLLMADPAKYYETQAKFYEPTEFSKDVRLLPQTQQAAAVEQKFLPPVVAHGSPVLTRGANGELRVDPASVAAIGMAKGAEGPYQAPIVIKTDTGKEVQLAPNEWAEYQKAGNLPMRYIPRDQRTAMQAEADRSGVGGNVNIQTPSGMVSGQVTPGQKSSGAVPPSGFGTLGISQSPAEKAEQEGFGKNLADYQKDIDDKANLAQIAKARIGEMRNLTQGFTSGSLTPYKEKLGGMMIAMGADPDSINAKMGNISDMQAFNKEALSMAFDMTKQLTSRPAASEVMLALKANPNLALQPDASKKIMDMIEGMTDYNLAKQQASQQWRNQNNNSINGFEANWNKENPITKYVDTASLNAVKPQGAAQPKPGASDIYDEFKLKRPRK